MTLPFGALSVGDTTAPAAVIAHGSASTAAFIVRVFADALADAGLRLVTWDRRTPPADAVDELAALVDATDAAVVGGLSVGGLIAAHYAVTGTRPLSGLLLALPPWIGTPDGPDRIAALSMSAAQDIATNGLAAVLNRMSASAPPWVAHEVAEAWSRWAATDEQDLVAELRATSQTAGPTTHELASCVVPTGIAAFDDDPLHPTAAGRAWARALPRAAMRTLSRDDAATDRGVIGAAAVSAWEQVISGSR